MKWWAEAGANIALIKYMGKTEGNVPTNASLSYLLPHLKSEVEILPGSSADRWESLGGFKLEGREIDKFMGFFSRLKEVMDLRGYYIVRSRNSFPKGTGLASSASSFAALTMAAGEVARSQNGRAWSQEALAQISRLGSGSSCRSFFGPWAVWDKESVRPAALAVENLVHQAIVLEEAKKEVSSSEAHQRVQTSLNFEGRVDRAETRLRILTEALSSGEWETAFRVTWAEFWDMHSLFETSARPFGYMTPQSCELLQELMGVWRTKGDGPLVTMDAGPNIHLLYREDQIEMAQQLRRDIFSHFRVISSYDKQI